MKLNCPECYESLSENFSCSNGHYFQFEENVLKLMSNEFNVDLEKWLVAFHDFRSNNVKPLDYDNLPNSGLQSDSNIWKARESDLQIISSHTNDVKSALDIGSWNGWLSHNIAKAGIQVTAVDYFIHEHDGLKARNHYANPNWVSIQMDLENLTVLQEKYDLIIVNRCYAYFEKSLDFLNQLKSMLTPNGLIVVTGINIQSTKEMFTEEYKKSAARFKEKYNQELGFKSFTQLNTKEELTFLKQQGFRVSPYSNWRNMLKVKLNLNKNRSYYAVFRKGNK